ncbi:MAG: tripartite tricarboxylate transporter substrate binding protein [Burkholderiales bacterium]|nr:tripartite tricarboxylate transporter substrate binding protein [Burkholderiales bacterium]
MDATRRRMLAGIAAGSSAAALSLPAQAQDYPSKPIRLIVPYPPGGGTDIIARILQERMVRLLGQPMVIENRGGAGGAVGTEMAAKAPADGYTVLFTLSSHTINPAIFPRLNYDVEKDFLGVSKVVSLPQILVAHPGLPVSNLQELVAMARSKPGAMNYASVGNGSPGHIAGELFKLKTGTDLVHIPYKGGGPAVTDVMAGQVPLLWVSIPAAASYVKSGKLKALAVSTLQRSSSFPDVPTVAEALIPDFEVDSWYAMFVPASSPPDVVRRLHEAVLKALEAPDVREKLLQQGSEVAGSSPGDLDRTVKAEVAKWKQLVQAANIKM